MVVAFEGYSGALALPQTLEKKMPPAAQGNDSLEIPYYSYRVPQEGRTLSLKGFGEEVL